MTHDLTYNTTSIYEMIYLFKIFYIFFVNIYNILLTLIVMDVVCLVIVVPKTNCPLVVIVERTFNPQLHSYWIEGAELVR